jgi:hypothetical protein
MKQQPKLRLEHIAMGTRIVRPLVLKAVDARYPAYGGLARFALRVLEEQMSKKGAGMSPSFLSEDTEVGVANDDITWDWDGRGTADPIGQAESFVEKLLNSDDPAEEIRANAHLFDDKLLKVFAAMADEAKDRWPTLLANAGFTTRWIREAIPNQLRHTSRQV